MKQQIWSVAMVLLALGAVRAADTAPPIPVVPKDARPVVAFERPKPNAGVWTRFEKFNEQAQAGGFDVVFIGDSITQGWEFPHGKALWDQRIAPFNAVNFGIGGDTTESVIWRLDHGNLAGALDPKVVVLMIGTNNARAGDKPEEIAAGIGAILERLHGRFPRATLLLYGVFPRIDPKLRATNDAVNRILATYQGHWNIKYVDLKPTLAKPDGAPLDGSTSDGLHPVEKGYAIWTDSLVTELNAILKPAAKTPAGVNAPKLWEQEPTLWDAARKYQWVRPLSPKFGWEGPAGREPGGEGVNISNERLQSSLWGTPGQVVLSLGKTDVFDRAKLNPYNGKKPVGQLLLLAEDFVEGEQPQVSTAMHSGVNSLRLTRGAATADVQVLLTRRETNVIAIKAVYANLTKPVSIRLYRHRDKFGHLPDPEGGSDGGYFWIHQQFAADKTFPQGFDYYLVAKIAGQAPPAQVATMQAGLGASVPFRDANAPGSAATVSLPAAARMEMTVYATVVTRAESADPLAEAKKRLADAERQGYAALLTKNESWYRSLYTRREQGRVFTGKFDEIKEVMLPFFHYGSFQSRHTFNSNPDPAKFEGDAHYNMLESDDVAWCGLQCFNEELYTGEYVSGRDEGVAPYYVGLFNFWRPVWETNAKRMGGQGLCILRGYVPPIINDVFWSPDGPANNPQAADWSSLVWAFKCVWDSFDYGGKDLTYLRDSVYPSLRGVADFFVSKTVPDKDGCYHIDPSQIREEDVGRDAVDCVAGAKWAFRTAIAAARLLQTDAAKQKVWENRLAKMAPYQIINNEKGEPVWASLLKDGKPVVAGHGTSHFLVNVADEIHLDSSEEQKQISIRANLFHYEQPMNRQVEFLLGKQADSLCGTSVFAHPPWMLYFADKVLRREAQARSVAAPVLQNTLPLSTPMGKSLACWLEPERLCNSRSGTIHFFPCVPGRFDVAFKDFQARGGFLVSGQLLGGAVTHARITARRSGVCQVMNPWPGQRLAIVEYPARTRVAATKDGERYAFPARAGKNYALLTDGRNP